MLPGPTTLLTYPMGQTLCCVRLLGSELKSEIIRQNCLGGQEFSSSVPASSLLDRSASCSAMVEETAGTARLARAEEKRDNVKAQPCFSSVSGVLLCDFQLLIRKFSRTCNGVSRWYVYIG